MWRSGARVCTVDDTEETERCFEIVSNLEKNKYFLWRQCNPGTENKCTVQSFFAVMKMYAKMTGCLIVEHLLQQANNTDYCA